MSKQLLRWLTIFIPVGFVLVLFTIIQALAGKFWDPWVFGGVILVVCVGAAFFSNWIFRQIGQREAEVQKRASQLEALNLAALSLITELDLGIVLQKVVDLSRDLVACRYGALGVLNEDGSEYEQFITSGVSTEERNEVGSLPSGRGTLGLMIKHGETLLLDDLAGHKAYEGFPQHHPMMRTLLGVPIRTKGRVIGNLYLSEKNDPFNQESSELIPFTDEDRRILEMFATQAAIAIENARLYRQVQQLAILEERQRFGMDLHDGVIQSIYAVGLMLEDVQRRIEANPKTAKENITAAIHSLNTAISDIRNYILDLRPQHFQGRNIVQGVEELARALRANTFIDVHLDMDDIDPRIFAPERTVEILLIAQEALANIQKHAKASEVDILLKLNGKVLTLQILDDGVSFNPLDLQRSRGNGLRNMQDRAAALNGDIIIGPRFAGGTEVRLTVPLN